MGRQLGVMQQGTGHIPFDWIADSTRWMRKPRSFFRHLQGMLEQSAETYRRDLWDSPKLLRRNLARKRGAGRRASIRPRHEWDVPLMVTRG